MKKALSFLLIALLATMAAQAAIDYGIEVGGVKVTSDNCDDVTGSSITANSKVSYSPTTNTLTLRRVRIYTNNEDCIKNTGCDGLTIRFVDTCLIRPMHSGRGIAVYKNTTVEIYDGSRLTISHVDTDQDDHASSVYCSNATLKFKGPGSMRIESLRSPYNAYYAYAFEGKSSNSTSELIFENIEVNAYSDLGMIDFHTVQFNSGADVYISIVCNYSAIRDCGDIIVNGHEGIVMPHSTGYSIYEQTLMDYWGETKINSVRINDKWAVVFNAWDFPNSRFRERLTNKYGDWLSYEEYNNLTELNVSASPNSPDFEKISSLQGISLLGNLTTLYCDYNKLTELDLRYNTKLTGVSCHHNNISSVVLPSNLTYLNCSNNDLTSLDLSGQSHLYGLACDSNRLSLLAVPTTIQELSCKNNYLTSIFLSLRSNLSYLDCSSNYINALDLTGLYELQYLYCSDNGMNSLTLPKNSSSDLRSINCSKNNFSRITIHDYPWLYKLNASYCTSLSELSCYRNALSELDVSGCTALKKLSCNVNPELKKIDGLLSCKSLNDLNIEQCNFSVLDVTSLTKLTDLNCSENHLSNISMSNTPALQYLYCGENELTALDLSNRSALQALTCHSNHLQQLNVKGCPNLSAIFCFDNDLQSLDLQGCSSLRALLCYQNNIRGSNMTRLVNSLPNCPASETGYLGVIHTSGEGNTITTDQITTARNKNWTPYRFDGDNWTELTGLLTGDVNGDGEVNIADINALVDMILIGSTQPVGDVNGDGEINIADVNALIDIILGK